MNQRIMKILFCLEVPVGAVNDRPYSIYSTNRNWLSRSNENASG